MRAQLSEVRNLATLTSMQTSLRMGAFASESAMAQLDQQSLTSSGIAVTGIPVWTSNTAVVVGSVDATVVSGCQVVNASRVMPTVDSAGNNAFTMKVHVCTTSGITGSSEPTWATTETSTTSDGTAVWTAYNCYHMDPSYGGGSNDGSQLHPYTDWTTINSNWAAGRAYRMKRGSSLAGGSSTANRIVPSTSGTVTAPILVTNYGSINSALPITQSTDPGVESAAIFNRSYVGLDGLRLQGGMSASNGGIVKAYCSGASQPTGLRITNCYFSPTNAGSLTNGLYVLQYQNAYIFGNTFDASGNFMLQGVFMDVLGASSANNTVKSNHFLNSSASNGWASANVLALSVSALYRHSAMVVANNDMTGAAVNLVTGYLANISLWNADNAIVTDNVMSGNVVGVNCQGIDNSNRMNGARIFSNTIYGTYTFSVQVAQYCSNTKIYDNSMDGASGGTSNKFGDYYSHAVETYGITGAIALAPDNTWVYRNVITNWKNPHGVRGEGCGLNFDDNSTRSIANGNHISGCDGAGILVNDNPGPTWIYGNVIVNCGINPATTVDDAGLSITQALNANFDSNIVSGCPVGISYDFANGGAKFLRNTFFGYTTCGVRKGNASGVAISSEDRNTFAPSGSAPSTSGGHSIGANDTITTMAALSVNTIDF